MRGILILVFLQFSARIIFAQLDSDFINAKRIADDCFKKGDYSCAKKNYNIALAIKENDEYCKKRLKTIQKKEEEEKIIMKNEKIKLSKENDKLRQQIAKQAAEKPYYGSLEEVIFLTDEYHYKGYILNNQPNGKGKLFIDDEYIEGEFKNGLPYGNVHMLSDDIEVTGQIIYKNNNTIFEILCTKIDVLTDSIKLIGNFIVSISGFYGKGQVFKKNQLILEGNIIDGELTGQGKQYDNNKLLYEGEFSNSEMNGTGKYYAEYGIYEGNFKKGKFNGYGTMILLDGYNWDNCPNSKKYIGEWKDDKKYGIGKCYDKNNILIYEGNFENDKPTQKYPNRK